MGPAAHAPVRTFLIADIRGYTRFTQQHGDEASARLTAKFSDLVREGAELRGGRLIELRGDEALLVFDSARQAIRAAMDLQRQFAAETAADPELPLNVGIGIDSGEAIALEDGGFRGAALNVAARLCAMAQTGEVIVTEGTSHLAGRLPGVRYVDRGRAHLKGIADPVRIIRAAPEDEQGQPRIFMLFTPKRLSWSVALGVMLIAAATAVSVVYLTGGNKGERGTAATVGDLPGGADARRAGALGLIPTDLSRHCVKQPVANVGAVETAVCVPPASAAGFAPDRWEVFPSIRAVVPCGRRTRPRAATTGSPATVGSATGSPGAERAHGLTGRGSPEGAGFATSTGTTPSSSGPMSACVRPRTVTCSPSRAKGAATTHG
jgi:class 3 adenylate cyclase